ncbi:MAG: hypothetical protein ACC650_03585 [Gammaproteobacteria bacterium]
MDNTSNTSPKKIPIWVLLAFSTIQKRKHALVLIWASVIFSVYSLPWVNFINHEIIATLFLIDDWSWVAIMIPLCLWYLICLRWMDQNSAWESA